MKTPYSLKPLLHQFGIEKLRKEQLQAISSIRAEHDTFLVAPTSFGKSLVTQLPAMEHGDKTTLIIEPTISLMHDQVNKLQNHGGNAAYLDSGQSKMETDKILNKLSNNQLNILYVTPERLSSEAFLTAIRLVSFYMIAVDEAHCVLDWGYNFRNAYLHIGDFIDKLPTRPIVVAMTATASQKQYDIIAELLHMQNPQHFRYSLDRPNLSFLVKHIEERTKDDDYNFVEKLQIMKPYIRKAYKSGSIVVYCLTRNDTAEVYNVLHEMWGNTVTYTHGGLKPSKRTKNELKFLTGECKIIVATSAFGMGIDKGDIRLIVHFNTPLSISDYFQQAGRAGRDGEKAVCLLLHSESDYPIGKSLLQHTTWLSDSARKYTEKCLNEMHKLVKSDNCIIHQILAAFDENSSKHCKRCSNCQRKRRGER